MSIFAVVDYLMELLHKKHLQTIDDNHTDRDHRYLDEWKIQLERSINNIIYIFPLENVYICILYFDYHQANYNLCLFIKNE